MNHNSKPKGTDIFKAFGILAESVALYREELLKNGFTRAESITLCGKYMEIILNMAKQEENND